MANKKELLDEMERVQVEIDEYYNLGLEVEAVIREGYLQQLELMVA